MRAALRFLLGLCLRPRFRSLLLWFSVDIGVAVGVGSDDVFVAVVCTGSMRGSAFFCGL